MKTKRITKIVAAAIAATGLGFSAVAANNQVWLKETLEGAPFKEGEWTGLQVKVEQEEKYNEHRFIDSETLVQLGWKMNPYLSVYLGDRWVYERSGGNGKLRAEQRPTFDLYLAAPEFWTLKFDFRSRFEYRDKHGSSAYMRYRERLRLRTSWSVTDFKFSPYVSEEAFFSDKPNTDKADLFDRSRAQLGVSFKPIPSLKELSCNLYYMVQHDMTNHSSTWTPTNVYGLELSYKF